MTLPSVTNALIDAEATGKAVVTREYVENTQFFTAINFDRITTPNPIVMPYGFVIAMENPDTANPFNAYGYSVLNTNYIKTKNQLIYGEQYVNIEPGGISMKYGATYYIQRPITYHASGGAVFYLPTQTGTPIMSINSIKADDETGNVTLDLTSDLGTLQVISDITTAPTSSTATGIKGEVRFVGTDRYECIATDTWVKSTVITTF